MYYIANYNQVTDKLMLSYNYKCIKIMWFYGEEFVRSESLFSSVVNVSSKVGLWMDCNWIWWKKCIGRSGDALCFGLELKVTC